MHLLSRQFGSAGAGVLAPPNWASSRVNDRLVLDQVTKRPLSRHFMLSLRFARYELVMDVSTNLLVINQDLESMVRFRLWSHDLHTEDS